MGNSTGNAEKNPRKQAKMIKQRKDAGMCRGKKENANQEKIWTYEQMVYAQLESALEIKTHKLLWDFEI